MRVFRPRRARLCGSEKVVSYTGLKAAVVHTELLREERGYQFIVEFCWWLLGFPSSTVSFVRSPESQHLTALQLNLLTFTIAIRPCPICPHVEWLPQTDQIQTSIPHFPVLPLQIQISARYIIS